MANREIANAPGSSLRHGAGNSRQQIANSQSGGRACGFQIGDFRFQTGGCRRADVANSRVGFSRKANCSGCSMWGVGRVYWEVGDEGFDHGVAEVFG